MAEIVSSIREDAAARRFDALMTSPELDTHPQPDASSSRPTTLGADKMATEALLEGDAVLLVYDDGQELLILPEPSGGRSP